MEVTFVNIAYTKNNKPYKQCVATDESGGITKFSVWSDNSRYHEIVVGYKLEKNDLEQNDKGYWGLVNLVKTGKGITKDAKMNAVMERKEQSIQKFQDSKEESIKKAGLQRDSVALVIAFYPELAKITEESLTHSKEEAIQRKLVEWKESLEKLFN